MLKSLCALAILINCYLISKYAFKDGRLICDNYIINNYLYVSLAFNVCILTVLLGSSLLINNEKIMLMLLCNFILVFVFLFWLLSINPRNIVQLHTIWLLLIITFSLTLVPLILLNNVENVQTAVNYTIIVVFTSLFLGYTLGPQLITFDWDRYLYFALIGIIIVSFVHLYLGDNNKYQNLGLYIAIASLIVFTLLIFSYSKKVIDDSKKCDIEKNPPNYPLSSYRLFSKAINVFANILRLVNRGRGRGRR
tara:strand:- start:145 stop:897 length:753 start_codon:yes stop_codon:yes gene_type:complete